MSTENVKFQMESNNIGMGISKVAQIIKYTDFTDGGGAAGTLTLDIPLPPGCFVIGSKCTVPEGFAGDVSADLKLGNAGDDDAYTAGSVFDVFAADDNLVLTAINTADLGLIANSRETEVLAVLTVDNDFGDCDAGKMLVEIYYLSTNVELDNGAPTVIRVNNE